MTEPVRLAVVGLGWWGTELIRATRASGAAEPVVCFARTEEDRTAFAREHGLRAAPSYQAMLADPEVEGVLLATSHSSHVDLVREAASAGKHVFVEKPLSLSIEEGRRAIESAEKHGIVLQVGHNRRRQQANRRIRGLIEDGSLGTITLAEANYSGSRGLFIDPQSWRADPAESPLGGMTGMGVHQVETLLYLVGAIRRVWAVSRRLVRRTALDDSTVLALEFESGAVGSLGTSYVTPWTVRLGVLGTGGAAWNELDGRRLLVQSIDERQPREEPVEENDTVAEEIAEFARCVRTGEVPETGGPEGLRVVAVLAAAMESADTGRPVDVEDVG
ncbi:MAG: Gfo/Idh/MocA family protein [Acidimicrobiia bacterium]